MGFTVKKYSDDYETRWDKFVNTRSINGTFLQTRNFLNYHSEGRFIDGSLMIMQGPNIVGVIPANEIDDENGRHLVAHMGSTFGGVVLDQSKYNIKTFEELMPCLDNYFREQNYSSVTMRQTSDIFCKRRMDMLDYYYYMSDWDAYSELSFYIELSKMPKDIEMGFGASRRRDYRYSLQKKMTFRQMKTAKEIEEFYNLLSDNLIKFGARPVHSLEELNEFRDLRLPENVDFYGVYYEDRLVAGTMLFKFGKKVMHTQYLAHTQNREDSDLYAMEFLNYNLIKLARDLGFEYFSFGISTEKHGKVINVGLASFKEGFGCDFCVNRTYVKKYPQS